MLQISDTTIIVLAVIALLTIIGGTLTILQRLGPDIPYLTGFATTDTGVVNVTVQATANIAFVVDVVDFGSGTLASSGILNINTSDTSQGGGGNPNGFDNPGPLSVRNDGNVDVNVTVNGSTAATFLGGTSPTYEFASTNYSVFGVDAAGDGCYQNRTNTGLTTMNGTIQLFCENLTFTDGNDTTNISIFLGIPSDVPSGLKQDTLISIFATQLG